VQPNPMVLLNGTPISLLRVSESGGVITMAGDISTFAAATTMLTFLCSATPGAPFPADENTFYLDDIQFSPLPVPEPSAFPLLGLGAVVFGLCRKRKRGVTTN